MSAPDVPYVGEEEDGYFEKVLGPRSLGYVNMGSGELSIGEALREYGALIAEPSERHPANVATSVVRTKLSRSAFGGPTQEQVLHYPVIDLDVPHHVVPSSTPGHSHLYIDVPLTDKQYEYLLETLVSVGIVQPGVLHSFHDNRATAVRLPWVNKSQAEVQAEQEEGPSRVHDPWDDLLY